MANWSPSLDGEFQSRFHLPEDEDVTPRPSSGVTLYANPLDPALAKKHIGEPVAKATRPGQRATD
jgi:hypothetical protein